MQRLFEALGNYLAVIFSEGQVLKSVLKIPHYSDILRIYRLNGKNENSMRNILCVYFATKLFNLDLKLRLIFFSNNMPQNGVFRSFEVPDFVV